MSTRDTIISSLVLALAVAGHAQSLNWACIHDLLRR
jgi:hypothetical protein